VTINIFTKANTDAWQARYDYNFAALGVPGLTFMTRYVDGSHAQTATVRNGREWERDTDLVYTVQSGPLKNVGLLARKSIYRNDFPAGAAFRDENQTRFLVLYTVALW